MPADGRCAAVAERRACAAGCKLPPRVAFAQPSRRAAAPGLPLRAGGPSGLRTDGFALLEVFVAATVLAVGLTGAAALATDAVRAQHGAGLRAQAVNLATELAERLRANRAGLLSYGETPSDFGCVSGVAAARRCTPGELARHELADWRTDIRTTLPDGRGAITTDPEAIPISYAITIRWAGRRGGEQFTLEGRM